MRHTRVKRLNAALIKSGMPYTKTMKRRMRKLWWRRHSPFNTTLGTTTDTRSRER